MKRTILAAVLAALCGAGPASAAADERACGLFQGALASVGESQERVGGYLERKRTDLACPQLEETERWVADTRSFYERCDPWLATKEGAAGEHARRVSREAMERAERGTDALRSAAAGLCAKETKCAGDAELLRQLVAHQTDEMEKAMKAGNRPLACFTAKGILSGALDELASHESTCPAVAERTRAREVRARLGGC